MNDPLQAIGPRRLGLILHALGLACLVIAVLVGWNAVDRWIGIAAIERAQLAAITGDRPGALFHGREAAAALPREVSAGLMAVDLSDPQAGPALTRLEQRVPLRNRPDVAALRALHRLLHGGGEPVGGLGAGDQALVTHVAALEKDDPPPALTLPARDPAHAPLLGYTAQRRFRDAWAAGDRASVRATAGELRLLLPTHPDAARLGVVLAALTPAVVDGEFALLVAKLKPDAARAALLRRLAVLAPERAAVLAPLIDERRGGSR
jgi:hypothetical protein